MRTDVIFLIWVAFFSTFGSAQNDGNRTLVEHSLDVDMLADKGKVINRIFKPSRDGFIGVGGFAFTFKGVLLPINEEIVMKFTKLQNKYLAEAEYEMYTYLHAINSSDVERYGIPAVYYYGEWKGHDLIMMGLTLLDKEVASKQLFKSDINVLIVLRDFILASKYVHSCYIRHDDVKLANMMILKSKTFLIDFNLGHKLNEKSQYGTARFKSRRAHKNGDRYPKDDWESFLYSMCTHLNVKFDWFDKNSREILQMKEDTMRTIQKIGTICSKRLRRIFISLAVHIFDDGGEFDSDDVENSGKNSFIHSNANVKDRFPDYDAYYKLVNDEIKDFCSPEPVLFSWLNGTARDDAIKDIAKYPVPDISKTRLPTNNDYISFKYPTVDKKFFTRMYKHWKPHVSNMINK